MKNKFVKVYNWIVEILDIVYDFIRKMIPVYILIILVNVTESYNKAFMFMALFAYLMGLVHWINNTIRNRSPLRIHIWK